MSEEILCFLPKDIDSTNFNKLVTPFITEIKVEHKGEKSEYMDVSVYIVKLKGGSYIECAAGRKAITCKHIIGEKTKILGYSYIQFIYEVYKRSKESEENPPSRGEDILESNPTFSKDSSNLVIPYKIAHIDFIAYVLCHIKRITKKELKSSALGDNSCYEAELYDNSKIVCRRKGEIKVYQHIRGDTIVLELDSQYHNHLIFAHKKQESELAEIEQRLGEMVES